MRLWKIHLLLLCLSIAVAGCAVPKKRSWSRKEDSSGAATQVAGTNKRTWIQTEGSYRISAGMAANRRSIWIERNATLEAMAPVKRQEPDLSPVETEPETRLELELEALALTGNWDDRRTADKIHAPVDHVAEYGPVYDFPITVNSQVVAYLELFQGPLRDNFSTWLARSGRYRPMMEAELKAAGLPLDLAYLSMIESGFSQRAYSKSQAVGLWQFMAATGHDYGLEVTEYLDERRAAEKPTKAAVAYLSDLYEEFGDWYLAVAAYNGGPGTLRNAIRKTESTDFWKIAQKAFLPLETERYVPKLIAAIIIAREPEKYGFTDIAYEKPVPYDTISVGPGLSFEAIAILTNSSSATIKHLNEELIAGRTPLDAESYTLKIPAGTKELAESNLSLLSHVVSTDYKTQVFGDGETLAQVFRRYSVNTAALSYRNNLKVDKVIASNRLRIPFNNTLFWLRDDQSGLTRMITKQRPEKENILLADAKKSAPDEQISADDYSWYQVKNGDSLWTISRRFNISPGELKKLNNLKSDLIHPGSRLRLNDA